MVAPRHVRGGWYDPDMGEACANIDLNLPDGPRLDALAGIASMFPWLCQRASLERKLREVPVLREALRERRLSYEKARLLARHLEKQEIPGWIERAQKLTAWDCAVLSTGKTRRRCAREASSRPGSLEPRLWWSRRHFRPPRKEAKRSLSLGECFVAIAEHFIEVWKPPGRTAKYAAGADPETRQAFLPGPRL